MEQQDIKLKCPTCNRTISKNPQRFSITEFYRRVKNITDIKSLTATENYILRVIKFYFSHDMYNKFTNELNRQINEGIEIPKIKEWILSYLMDSPEPLEIRRLSQIRDTSLLKKVRDYITLEYVNKTKDLNIPFSQFYEDFNKYINDKHELPNSKISRQNISRILKALGIHTKSKKILNKSQICLDISQEVLSNMFN